MNSRDTSTPNARREDPKVTQQRDYYQDQTGKLVAARQALDNLVLPTPDCAKS